METTGSSVQAFIVLGQVAFHPETSPDALEVLSEARATLRHHKLYPSTAILFTTLGHVELAGGDVLRGQTHLAESAAMFKPFARMPQVALGAW